MRTLFLWLLFSCATGVALAQSPAAAAGERSQTQSPPGLTVVKHSWSKERINWEGNPFGGTVEDFEDMRRRMADQRRVERARSTGNSGETARVEREMRAEQVIKSRPPAPPRYSFLYKISIRNTGEKTFKEIDWDYVFSDAATGAEVSRREFTAVERLAPGKQKEFTFFSPTPPTRTVSADKLGKRERDTIREHVVVMRILYADGSVWQRP
jgi:uncharacterized protein affecting Mg2+/Co2+ transport